MKLILLFLAMLVAVPAAAKTKGYPNCFQNGFEFVAGFRWDREVACPTLEEPDPKPEYCDPVFLGLQQRLALNEYFTLQARLDRDVIDNSGRFIQTPRWNAAVSLNWAPWK